MARLELRPFSEDFVAAAGELLAARHRAHRAAEPLLPERYEDPVVAGAAVAELAAAEGASGAVALRNGRTVGFLLGAPRPDPVWGQNAWVELAGHAADDPEDVRDLYGGAAAAWVEAGRTEHYALVPASGDGLVRAWFRVGFGQQQAYGAREVPDVPWPDGARPAEPRDADALLELSPVLSAHQAQAPVFAAGPEPPPDDELHAEILDDLANDEIGDLVAERDGVVVAALQVVPAELSATHAGPARPDGAALIGWAATRPELRGGGAGLALTQAAFAWARERGLRVIVADWRVTNLLASRFWAARGFRETFLRLHRHIG
jgi:ribosomal protein S18 acetylase RimI-like enzyme